MDSGARQCGAACSQPAVPVLREDVPRQSHSQGAHEEKAAQTSQPAEQDVRPLLPDQLPGGRPGLGGAAERGGRRDPLS